MAFQFKGSSAFGMSAAEINTPSQGEFEKFPDGACTVTGFHSWIEKDLDDQQLPTWVPNSWNSELTARMALRQEDGTEGPPISLTRPQLAAFIYALGGDPSELMVNGKIQATAQTLLAAQDILSNVTGTYTVWVRNGWASSYGLPIPDSLYNLRFQYAGAKGVDEGCYGTDNNGEAYINVYFVIDGDMMGRPTPYDGFTVSQKMFQAFDGTWEPNGHRMPKLRKGKRGGTLAPARRTVAFQQMYCPDKNWESYQWTDAELVNPWIALVREAKAANRANVGHVRHHVSKSGALWLKVDVETFVKGEDTATDAPDLRQSLVDALFETPEGQATFVNPDPYKNNDYTLTDAGKAWIVSLWDTNYSTFPRNLGKLTDEQITTILDDLVFGTTPGSEQDF